MDASQSAESCSLAFRIRTWGPATAPRGCGCVTYRGLQAGTLHRSSAPTIIWAVAVPCGKAVRPVPATFTVAPNSAVRTTLAKHMQHPVSEVGVRSQASALRRKPQRDRRGEERGWRPPALSILRDGKEGSEERVSRGWTHCSLQPAPPQPAGRPLGGGRSPLT